MRASRPFAQTILSASLMILLCAGGVALGDSHITVAQDGSVALERGSAANPPVVHVGGYDQGGVDLMVGFDALNLTPRTTKGGEFVDVGWPDASRAGAIGAPAIPVVRRLIKVPAGVTVSVSTMESVPVIVDGATAGVSLRVMPVQPPIPKLPGAMEAAEFMFDTAAYAGDTVVPAERATVEELGIARGERVFLLEVRPVGYSPAAKTLTIWREIEVAIDFIGERGVASEVSPLAGLNRIVLNPDTGDTSAPRTPSSYVIVVASAYESGIASFAAAKTAQGYDVTTFTIAAGSSTTLIKSYIQALWDGGSPPDYILLVGDTDTIPNWTGGGEGSPATDLPYACMDGSSDWYPDIPLGRFSVRSPAQLQAVVDKTLYYQNGPLADPDYLKRAVFMAGNDNYNITEGTHNYVISTHMDPNDYISDKIYEVTYGGTTADVSAAFNDGRFFGIFSGHGGTYVWDDGPYFTQTNVNALTNSNMYPYVYSFACITGTYTVNECFTETWHRAANKGSIAIYGSSVNSYWTEDDILEKRLFDTIFDADDDVPAEVGPVQIETLLRYVQEMGSGSTTRRYFEMYNLLGDPSTRFPGACSDAGSLTMDRVKYACEGSANLVVSDCALNTDNGTIDTVLIDIDSDSETGVEQVMLIETDASSAEFAGSIDISTLDSPGVLLIADGDTITATYIDADDGAGGTDVVVAVDATVDCLPPEISGVQAMNVEARTATIAIEVNEPTKGDVYFGESCASLTGHAASSIYSANPEVGILGLEQNTTYFYSVEVEDEAGNTASCDNEGYCYSFTTPALPKLYTEEFVSAGDNDLGDMTVTFTPVGTNNFYSACVEPLSELPIDPAGGTILSLSDDDFEQVTPAGGAVPFYGTDYTSFYVGSNGYITFNEGDQDYTESLTDHFRLPRISALFDDLDPSQAGEVSFKELPDRMVVTWLAVTERNYGNDNTFQIEMFFDGRLQVSYLNVDVLDGLAGLSKGEGYTADYFEMDLTDLGACGVQAPTMPDAPSDVKKNRYLAIVPNNIGASAALQVELTSMKRCSLNTGRTCGTDADCGDPEPDDGLCVEHPAVGFVGWVSEPFDPSCQTGPGAPEEGPCARVDNVARVVDTPVYRAWPEGLVFIGDCEILPVATFAMRATIDGVVFSDPLEVGTISRPSPQHFGDTVGENIGEGYTPPQGVVNVSDVQAYLVCAAGLPGAPHLTQVDLHGLGEGCIPNYILNVSDLQFILFGLEGRCFDESPQYRDPSDCP
ncbi:MAG: hypothetical protein JSU63_18185 [Phycisphaerales bacterium]|nr:MAG: hypothetical protein JSU63_18185 [Phycisphaerales bacterium]